MVAPESSVARLLEFPESGELRRFAEPARIRRDTIAD